MLKFFLLTAATALVSGVMTSAVWANDVDHGAANALMPLETKTLGVQADPSLMATVAERVNQSAFAEAEPSDDILSAIDPTLLDDILDEDGNLALPLGLTVFSCMGDPSIGFGSKL